MSDPRYIIVGNDISGMPFGEETLDDRGQAIERAADWIGLATATKTAAIPQASEYMDPATNLIEASEQAPEQTKTHQGDYGTVSVVAVPPGPSGLDSLRLLFEPPEQPPGNPASGCPNLQEVPRLLLRGSEKTISQMEELGYRFVRAERKPNSNGPTRLGQWPWEEVELP